MTILPIKLTNDDTDIPLSRIAVIDLEASGLGSASHPTELGWSTIGENGTVTSGGCLIRPPARWTMYKNAWSPASERLTGISRAMLDGDGLPPTEPVERFLEAVGNRDLYSDEPDFDQHWLAMLEDAAGISLGGRKLGDARKLIEQMGVTEEFREASGHRAEADARRLATVLAQGERGPLRTGKV